MMFLFQEKCMDPPPDRERETDRQTDRQTERQRDRETETQRERYFRPMQSVLLLLTLLMRLTSSQDLLLARFHRSVAVKGIGR